MIAAVAAPVLDWYADHRRRRLDQVWRRPAETQEIALRSLLWAASDTEFGLAHGDALLVLRHRPDGPEAVREAELRVGGGPE